MDSNNAKNRRKNFLQHFASFWRLFRATSSDTLFKLTGISRQLVWTAAILGGILTCGGMGVILCLHTFNEIGYCVYFNSVRLVIVFTLIQ